MQLHDQTRRLLSLLIFFLLGPMLTLGILAGIGLRKLPSNAKQFEYELTKQTGIQWRIQKVEYLRPGCVRLKGVEIVDETTAKSIFEADHIDVSRLDDKNPEKYFSDELKSERSAPGIFGEISRFFRGGSHGFRLISIPNSVVKLDHYPTSKCSADAVWMQLSKFLARFPQLSETPVHLVMENVGVFSVASRNKPGKIKFEPLRFVQGNLYRTEGGVRSDWAFQMPEASQLETQKFSLVRYDSGELEIELRTGTVALPCEMAAVFCSAFDGFGAGSRFSGDFSVCYHGDTATERTIRLQNVRFQDVDVSHVADAYTSFDVSGNVEILQITRATFGPEIFFAEGYLRAVNGEIDSILFNRFVQQFQLTVRPGDVVESGQAAIPYEDCVVFFRLLEDGAEFWPDQQWPEGMLMARKGDGVRMRQMTVHFPMEHRPTEHRRPVSYHAILSLLAPDTAPVVPLTPSLRKIYSVIPVGDPRIPTGPSTGSPIMAETIKNADRFLATEPLPQPASPYPVIANPDAQRQ